MDLGQGPWSLYGVPDHACNNAKLVSATVADDALETSTVAESERGELASMQRWADLVDTDDEDGPAPGAPLDAGKPRWADLMESDDEGTKPLATEPRESATTPGRHYPESRAAALRPCVPASTARGAVTGREAAGSRTGGSKDAPKQSAGKAAGKGKHRGSKVLGKIARNKHQCQFIIGVEEDADFGVVRRILGRAGANMKSIASKTGVKLRLRGRGSKFLEGPEQRESTDDLMLCLSGEDEASFEEAKELVSEILRDIYEKYGSFCRRVGRLPPAALTVQVHYGYRAGSR